MEKENLQQAQLLDGEAGRDSSVIDRWKMGKYTVTQVKPRLLVRVRSKARVMSTPEVSGYGHRPFLVTGSTIQTKWTPT